MGAAGGGRARREGRGRQRAGWRTPEPGSTWGRRDLPDGFEASRVPSAMDPESRRQRRDAFQRCPGTGSPWRLSWGESTPTRSQAARVGSRPHPGSGAARASGSQPLPFGIRVPGSQLLPRGPALSPQRPQAGPRNENETQPPAPSPRCGHLDSASAPGPTTGQGVLAASGKWALHRLKGPPAS